MRVRASSLNYRDLMVLKTGGRGPTKIGVVPLSDGAGEVAATGEGVTRVKIGDRIAGCFHPRWFGGPIKPDYLTDRLGANLDSRLVAPGSRVTSEPDPTTVSRSARFIRSEPCVCRRVRGWDLEFESGLLQRRVVQTSFRLTGSRDLGLPACARGAVGREPQRTPISRQPAAISLRGHIPVPYFRRCGRDKLLG
jgi:Alcohol dehydrogenase GroES-like domain